MIFNIKHITCLLIIIYSLSPSRGDTQALLKYEDGHVIAMNVYIAFHNLFTKCLSESMPNQDFIMDNLQSFVNFPSKTTVGFAPKFTSNRRFFANMIGTNAFKEMLSHDEEELRKGFIKKLKFCDVAVMDQELLKEFYAKEVDQSKI